MGDQNKEVSRSDRIAVSDLRPGERVKTVLMALEKQALVARTGSPYLTLLLGDRTGTVSGKVWEKAQQYDERFEVGDLILVDAYTETYKGQIQLRVAHLERVTEEAVDIGDFQPASKYDRSQMLSELQQLVAKEVGNTGLKKLLLAILGDEEVSRGLLRAPAAKLNHHAYIGGLLEHTLSMCRLAIEVGRHYAVQYPGILDTDTLLAGALLHDIGKIWEYSSERQIDLTDAGRLVGHMSLAVDLLNRTMSGLKMEDEPLGIRLKHMILSHHGELEYGAAVLPQTPEAQLLHYIDQIDAKMNMFAEAIGRTEGPWSDYIRSLGRFVYAGGATSNASNNPSDEADSGEADQTGAGETLDLFLPPKQG